MRRLVFASTTELPAVAPSAPAASTAAEHGGRTGPRFTPGRFYLIVVGAALLIGAVSLLVPSTPSYDPWAWLVWGREILHVNLQTTGGPSWKPLPVLFTTVFSLFGGATPDLWLVVARAGAVVSVVMVFKIAWRLTAGLTGRLGDGIEGQTGRRTLTWLAPLLAGLLAAGSLANSRGFISDNALGYSEGLMTALVLIALDRHLDGARRQAFVVGFFAALDRPELWFLWGPYGLYLWWKDPGARRLVIGLFAMIPVFWFLPELWGSGHLFRGVSRAQHPRSNSAAFASCPFCSEFSKHAWPTVLNRVKVPAVIAVLVAACMLGLRGRAVGLRRLVADRGAGLRQLLTDPTSRAQALLLAAGVIGFGWWIGIAAETQAGFSGNDRYLVLGAALVSIAGAVGWAWLAGALAGLARRVVPAASLAAAGGAGAAAAIVLFLAVPPWIGNNIIDLQRTHRALVYQAHLRDDAAAIVRKYGGAKRLLGCGTIMTEGFQVPMVAWTLDVHTARVQASPVGTAPITGPYPNAILQARAQRSAHLLPIVRQFTGARYTYAAHVRTFRLFTDCHR